MIYDSIDHSDVDVTAKRVRMQILASAAFFQEARRKVTDIILPFNDVGADPAIYCVHPVSGSASGYRGLSKLLGPEQRFYGVQAPSHARNSSFPCSIEKLGQFYADELMTFQPTGAFNLAGHSVGAMIALEIAQQLRARGRDVELLVVLDGEIFNTGAEMSALNPIYWLQTLANIPAWFRDFVMVECTVPDFFRAAAKKIRAVLTGISNRMRGVASSGHAVEAFIDLTNVSQDHAGFMKALYEAQYRYFPKTYSGNVLVLAAKTQSLTHLRQLHGPWKRIAPQAEFVTFQRVTHTSMIRDPEGAPLAEFLRARLKDAVKPKGATHK